MPAFLQTSFLLLHLASYPLASLCCLCLLLPMTRVVQLDAPNNCSIGALYPFAKICQWHQCPWVYRYPMLKTTNIVGPGNNRLTPETVY